MTWMHRLWVWVCTVLAKAAFIRWGKGEDRCVAIVKAARLLLKGKAPWQKDVLSVNVDTAKWWKLIGCDCCCVSFFLLCLSPSFFTWKQGYSWVGYLGISLLSCLYSYSRAGWAHNSCRKWQWAQCLLAVSCFLLAKILLREQEQWRSGLCPEISAEMWVGKCSIELHNVVSHEEPPLPPNAPLITHGGTATEYNCKRTWSPSVLILPLHNSRLGLSAVPYLYWKKQQQRWLQMCSYFEKNAGTKRRFSWKTSTASMDTGATSRPKPNASHNLEIGQAKPGILWFFRDWVTSKDGWNPGRSLQARISCANIMDHIFGEVHKNSWCLQ